MTDELFIATSVLAGFTAVLAIATIAYAWYTRQQVKLLAVGHELTKTQIAVEVVAARVSARGPFDLDKRIQEEKQRLGFAEKKDTRKWGYTA